MSPFLEALFLRPTSIVSSWKSLRAAATELSVRPQEGFRVAKTGISRLLIASAIDPDVYRRLRDFPEETFDEFDLADEDRELLRHPDHRLLRVLGAALTEENSPTSVAADVATMAAPAAAAAGAPSAAVTRAGAPPGMPTA